MSNYCMRLINEDTGECEWSCPVKDEEAAELKANKSWVKCLERGLQQLLHKDITVRMVRIIAYMLLIMRFGNFVFTSQRDIAKHTNIKLSHVNVVMQQLIKLEFCVPVIHERTKQDDPEAKQQIIRYIVNPEFFYRGYDTRWLTAKKYFYKSCCDYRERKEKAKQQAAPPSPSISSQPTNEDIETLKSLISNWINSCFSKSDGVQRETFTAIYPAVMKKFLEDNGYNEIILKVLTHDGFMLREKDHITRAVKIDKKVVRMYCIQKGAK